MQPGPRRAASRPGPRRGSAAAGRPGPGPKGAPSGHRSRSRSAGERARSPAGPPGTRSGVTSTQIRAKYQPIRRSTNHGMPVDAGSSGPATARRNGRCWTADRHRGRSPALHQHRRRRVDGRAGRVGERQGHPGAYAGPARPCPGRSDRSRRRRSPAPTYGVTGQVTGRLSRVSDAYSQARDRAKTAVAARLEVDQRVGTAVVRDHRPASPTGEREAREWDVGVRTGAASVAGTTATRTAGTATARDAGAPTRGLELLVVEAGRDPAEDLRDPLPADLRHRLVAVALDHLQRVVLQNQGHRDALLVVEVLVDHLVQAAQRPGPLGEWPGGVHRCRDQRVEDGVLCFELVELGAGAVSARAGTATRCRPRGCGVRAGCRRPARSARPAAPAQWRSGGPSTRRPTGRTRCGTLRASTGSR